VARKLRTLLVVPDLQDLGVQHDVRCLMRYWDRNAFEPVMLLHKREGAFADQFGSDLRSMQVDDLIPDIRGLRILLRVEGYARAFRAFRPHAVIAFVPYTNLASAWARPLSGMRFGLAVSEHAHVTASMLDRESFTPGFYWFYRQTFSEIYNHSADLVKCIAEESRQDLIRNHGIDAARTRLIHNPVDVEEVQELALTEVDHPWLERVETRRTPVIINVGRLARQKRQDVLLDAFALLRRTHAARLIFIGRGAYKERLAQQAERLGVAADVAFLGFQRNPWKFMARATLLALSSEWEGLPCVLTEAMSLRLPIVASRCPSGPSEMLLEGRAGLLCPVGDSRALAQGIADILDGPDEAKQRADEAYAHVDRFRPERIAREYEDLARELADLSGA